MVSEGEFPKADGDVWYDGDVNRVARAGGFIAGGNRSIGSFTLIGSSTAGLSTGSFVIAAGSLPAEFKMNIFATTTSMADGLLKLQLSGTDFGVDTTINVPNPVAGVIVNETTSTLGWSSIAKQYSQSTSSLAEQYAITNVGTVYPNSGLVIDFILQHSAAGTDAVDNAFVTFERASY